MNNFPKYTESKHKGNKGEAFVQFILSNFCLVHKIDGSNDLGNDFICELIKKQSPTNLLFYVQVKFTSSKPRVKKSTLNYWRGSPIPVYLFWVKHNNPPDIPDPEDGCLLEYKRYTPFLHNERKHRNEEFKPYDEPVFKRDLIVDYTRCQNINGYTPIIKPGDFLEIGEKRIIGMGDYALYIKDVIPEYSREILNKCWINNYVTATLLLKRKRKGDTKKALGLLETSLSLISNYDKKKFSELYNEVKKLKKEIDTLNKIKE